MDECVSFDQCICLSMKRICQWREEEKKNWRVKRRQAPFSFRKTQGVINEEWRSRNSLESNKNKNKKKEKKKGEGEEEEEKKEDEEGKEEKQRRKTAPSLSTVDRKEKEKTRKTQQLVDQRLGPVLSFSAFLASLGRLTLLLRLFESAREKRRGERQRSVDH